MINNDENKKLHAELLQTIRILDGLTQQISNKSAKIKEPKILKSYVKDKNILQELIVINNRKDTYKYSKCSNFIVIEHISLSKIYFIRNIKQHMNFDNNHSKHS